MGTSISKGRSFSGNEFRKTKFLIMKPPGSAQQFDRDDDIICFKRLGAENRFAGWFSGNNAP